MSRKTLFNIARMVNESEKDTPIEVSFLMDFDYVCKKLNTYEPRYYFKQIDSQRNPEYFDTSKGLNVVCVDTLPEPCKERCINEVKAIYHTNDQKYYVCLYSDGKPSKHYKPSSMHCIRNMYYQITGADVDKQTDKTSDFYGICESGTDRHKRIQHVISKMKENGVDCEFVSIEDYIKQNNLPLEVISVEEYETKVFDSKRNIIFLCDGILKYKGQYLVLEIKTESQYKWGGRTTVDSSHHYQAWTYALEFGIDKVLFIYENRDLCSKKPFLLTVSDDDKQYIEDRVSKCDEYVSQRVVPPKEETVTSKVCQYCQYRTQCKVDPK